MRRCLTRPPAVLAAGLWPSMRPAHHSPRSGGRPACKSPKTLNPKTLTGCRSDGDTAFEEEILVRAPQCEVHIFDPTLDRAEVAEVEAVASVEFHDFGLGHRDQRVRHPLKRLLPPKRAPRGPADPSHARCACTRRREGDRTRAHACMPCWASGRARRNSSDGMC